MADWTPVLSRKDAKCVRQEAKRVAKLCEFMDKAVKIVDKKGIDYCSLVQGPTSIMDRNQCGTIKPVTMEWPAVQKVDSVLLAECVGSTAGKELLKHQQYIGSFASVAALLENYAIPIYHIDYEVNTDMGYDSKGRRAPYTDSIDIFVWTYAANHAPVVHKYSLNVSGFTKKSASCRYCYSFSPVKEAASMKKYNYVPDYDMSPDFVDCVVHMMELCGPM